MKIPREKLGPPIAMLTPHAPKELVHSVAMTLGDRMAEITGADIAVTRGVN